MERFVPFTLKTQVRVTGGEGKSEGGDGVKESPLFMCFHPPANR